MPVKRCVHDTCLMLLSVLRVIHNGFHNILSCHYYFPQMESPWALDGSKYSTSPSVASISFYFQTEPWIDSAGQPDGGVALHMQPWPQETRGGKILSEICQAITTSGKIKVFLVWRQFLPDSIEFMCRTKREIANAKNKNLALRAKPKWKRKHYISGKAVFHTNTKVVRFIVIVFGQMSSGHQVCSPSATFLQIYTILSIRVWEENDELPVKWQPDSAESSVKPRHEWWSGLALVWRVRARRCLITSAGDLSLPSLLIFCPLKWKSVLRLRLSTESSSVRLRTSPLSFYLWDDVDRLFISKSKTQYCL